MFFVFGKCPFPLRWKNVLSGSHALHLRFIRNKSVTRMVISVIDRLLSGTHLVTRFWLTCAFPVTCPVLVRSLLNFQAPHADRESFERHRR